MDKLELAEGEIYLLEGPQQLKVLEGEIEVVGANLEEGEELEIPRGKTIPVEGRAKSVVQGNNLRQDKIEELEERTIPESWDELTDELNRNDYDCVLVAGEMDTGKTFFSTYLTNSLLANYEQVGVMDCDLGQSDIGPPGTIGLTKVAEPAVALDTVEWDELAFTGAHSPGLHLVPFLSGIRHLADQTLEDTDILIVDTTGWVQGDGGRTVKQGKIDMLDPDKIVLLQKDNELEHLVQTVSDARVKRVKVSDAVTPTPPSERKGLRERSMKSYMEEREVKTLDLDKFGLERVYYDSGTPLQIEAEEVLHAEKLSGWEGVLAVVDGKLSATAEEKLSEYGQVKTVSPDIVEGVLVGFTTEDNVCIGLGIIESLDFEERKITVHTPLENPEDAYRIQFGSVRYKPDGTENGFIEPGAL